MAESICGVVSMGFPTDPSDLLIYTVPQGISSCVANGLCHTAQGLTHMFDSLYTLEYRR